MDRKMNEIAAPMMTLGDEELLAVAGAHGRHLGWYKGGGEKVTQSNKIGDITVYAPDNSGTITVNVTQINAA
jgi:hypothetical protein